MKHCRTEWKITKMNEALWSWVKNCENELNVKKFNETMRNQTKHCGTHGNIMKLNEMLWKIMQPKERNQRLSENWSHSQRWSWRLRIRRIEKIVGNYCPVADLIPPWELDKNHRPTGDFSSSIELNMC